MKSFLMTLGLLAFLFASASLGHPLALWSWLAIALLLWRAIRRIRARRGTH